MLFFVLLLLYSAPCSDVYQRFVLYKRFIIIIIIIIIHKIGVYSSALLSVFSTAHKLDPSLHCTHKLSLHSLALP